MTWFRKRKPVISGSRAVELKYPGDALPSDLPLVWESGNPPDEYEITTFRDTHHRWIDTRTGAIRIGDPIDRS